MGLPRTFVGFSSTDINYYRTMLMWKAHEHIDFDFCDCQLQGALNSTDENYVKRRCRDRIDMAGGFILLVGQDTRFKRTYVKWEVEVAIEKTCRLIAANIDAWRKMNPPRVLRTLRRRALSLCHSRRILSRMRLIRLTGSGRIRLRTTGTTFMTGSTSDSATLLLATKPGGHQR